MSRAPDLQPETPPAFRVVHIARYAFDDVVAPPATLTAHLDPCGSTFHQLVVRPLPASVRRSTDAFGNRPATVVLAEPFGTLSVTAVSVARPADIHPPADAALLSRLLLPSPRVPHLPEHEAYARLGLPDHSREAVERFMVRIRSDYDFDARLGSPDEDALDSFLRRRRGVCQDFAHFTIACLRARGLPACYVSGYPARPTERGASHAWVAVHLPGEGWLALDPTHGRTGALGHIPLGFGRDHSDIAPLSGVLTGGPCRMSTSVTVQPA